MAAEWPRAGAQTEPVALETPLPPSAATPPTPRVAQATHRHRSARGRSHEAGSTPAASHRSSVAHKQAVLEAKPVAAVPPGRQRRRHGRLEREHARAPNQGAEHHGNNGRDDDEAEPGDAQKPKKAKEHPQGTPPGQLKRQPDGDDQGDENQDGDSQGGGGNGGGDQIGSARPRLLPPPDR